MDRARNVEHLVHKRKPRGGTTEDESQPEPAPREASDILPAHLLSPEELYRRERARRGHARSQSDALAAAREAYHALLREEAASGKGGRPRSKQSAPAKPAATEDLDADLHGDHVEVHDDAHDELHVEAHEEPHLDEPHHDEPHHDEPEEIVAAAPRAKSGAAAPQGKRRGRPPAAKSAARPASRAPARSSARPAKSASKTAARKKTRK